MSSMTIADPRSLPVRENPLDLDVIWRMISKLSLWVLWVDK